MFSIFSIRFDHSTSLLWWNAGEYARIGLTRLNSTEAFFAVQHFQPSVSCHRFYGGVVF